MRVSVKVWAEFRLRLRAFAATGSGLELSQPQAPGAYADLGASIVRNRV